MWCPTSFLLIIRNDHCYPHVKMKEEVRETEMLCSSSQSLFQAKRDLTPDLCDLKLELFLLHQAKKEWLLFLSCMLKRSPHRITDRRKDEGGEQWWGRWKEAPLHHFKLEIRLAGCVYVSVGRQRAEASWAAVLARVMGGLSLLELVTTPHTGICASLRSLIWTRLWSGSWNVLRILSSQSTEKKSSKKE